MKIVAFGASSSKNSINRKLAFYAASFIDGADIELLDLNDYEMPLFSVDKETELGAQPQAQAFLDKIASADALVISFAEHNGNYSVAYKNIYDWCSRLTRSVYQDKPTLILATSPGPRGGKSVLELAQSQLPRFGADLRASLSVPSFNENFDEETQTITNADLLLELKKVCVGSIKMQRLSDR